jgi:DNA-binding beta-propeller fold protein YncE
VLQVGEEAKNLSYMGSFGTGDGQFAFPNGIAVDGKDRIYVTDRGNNRIQVWLY